MRKQRPGPQGLDSSPGLRIQHLSSCPVGVTLCLALRAAQSLGLSHAEAMLCGATREEKRPDWVALELKIGPAFLCDLGGETLPCVRPPGRLNESAGLRCLVNRTEGWVCTCVFWGRGQGLARS